MQAKICGHFDVWKYRYLDTDGMPYFNLPALEAIGVTIDDLKHGYYLMMLARKYSERIMKLTASDASRRVPVYAPGFLEEAALVALGLAMEPDDVFVPSYRGEATRFARAFKQRDTMPMVDALHGCLRFWAGDERGHSTGLPPQDFPFQISVGAQIPHAVGIAKKLSLLGTGRIAVAECGDGATSKGDFLAGINFAGAWKVPLVILVRNNQYAISVPVSKQTAATSLAQKAIGAGIHGEQVDGNDFIALLVRLRLAMRRAREGSVPSVIEAMTYRGGPHTNSDNPTRYRTHAEETCAWAKDPLIRVGTYLRREGHFVSDEEDRMTESCDALIEEAVRMHEADMRAPLPPSSMIEHLFETLPHQLLPIRNRLSGMEE